MIHFETPPQSVTEFQDRLSEAAPRLPKRLQQCADYLAAHPEKIALGKVADLASEAGVAPSAMMRFCQALGFDGFSDMQRLFRGAMQNELPDYATRLNRLSKAGSGSPSALLAEFIDAGSKSLEKLASTVDDGMFEKAAQQLSTAQTIHLMGMRRAFPVASYMGYAFEKMDIPAMLHNGMGGLDFMHALRPGDAVIAITFAPYSAETLNLTEAAIARDLPVVMITDKRTGLARAPEVLPILVSEVDFGAFRSLSATLTVAISLAVAIGATRNPN